MHYPRKIHAKLLQQISALNQKATFFGIMGKFLVKDKDRLAQFKQENV